MGVAPTWQANRAATMAIGYYPLGGACLDCNSVHCGLCRRAITILHCGEGEMKAEQSIAVIESL